MGVDGTVPEGQGIVMAHLNECHELLEMVTRSIISFHFERLLKLVLRTQLKESMDGGDEEDYEDEDSEDPIVSDE